MKEQVKRRAAAFDAAIATLSEQIGALHEKRREKVRDLNSDPEELGRLSLEIQALRDKLAVQQELRHEATKLDVRDEFMRERGRIKELVSTIEATLDTRRKDAKELAELCLRMRVVLDRIGGKTIATWPTFVQVAKYLTRGDRHRNRYDSLVSTNQRRIDIKAGMLQLVADALRVEDGAAASAIGKLEAYVEDANTRLSRHVAVAFRHKVDELMQLPHDDLERIEPSEKASA